MFGIYLLGLQCFRVNEWLHQCQHLNDRRHLQMAMNKYLLKKFVYTLSCAMAFLHTLKWGACSCLCLSVRLFAAKQRIVCFFFFLQLLLNGFYALWTIFIFHILSSNNHFFFNSLRNCFLITFTQKSQSTICFRKMIFYDGFSARDWIGLCLFGHYPKLICPIIDNDGKLFNFSFKQLVNRSLCFAVSALFMCVAQNI